jgi:hypothetical protein
MWIKYGSNSIGHSAAWVRASSVDYLVSGLPDLMRRSGFIAANASADRPRPRRRSTWWDRYMD